MHATVWFGGKIYSFRLGNRVRRAEDWFGCVSVTSTRPWYLRLVTTGRAGLYDGLKLRRVGSLLSWGHHSSASRGPASPTHTLILALGSSFPHIPNQASCFPTPAASPPTHLWLPSLHLYWDLGLSLAFNPLLSFSLSIISTTLLPHTTKLLPTSCIAQRKSKV